MDARKEIRERLDVLFQNAPENRASWELQEELFSNCIERYYDLVNEGMEEERAINMVISNLGNVEDLIAELPEYDMELQHALRMHQKQRTAIITSISVGLYILAGVVLLIGAFIGEVWNFEYAPLIGLIVAMLICIVPTCMLVYSAKQYPKYKKKEDTLVEEFKEWSNDSKKTKTVRAALSSLLWTVTVAVYLIVSFMTFAWHITWIIFIIASCLEAAINLFFKLQEWK